MPDQANSQLFSVIKVCLLVGLLINSSCAHTNKDFEQHLSAKSCDQALENLPEKTLGAQVTSRTQRAAGTGVSYLLTGASYTGEFLWDVAGGTLVFVALCGPMLAVAMAAQGSNTSSMNSLTCLPGGSFDALAAPPLGRKTFAGTKNMRCPVLEPLSRSVRRVASCYEEVGGDANARKGLESLRAVQRAEGFFDCLESEEKDAVQSQIERLAKRLEPQTT